MKEKNYYVVYISDDEIVWYGELSEEEFAKKVAEGDFEYRDFGNNILTAYIDKDWEEYGEVNGRELMVY